MGGAWRRAKPTDLRDASRENEIRVRVENQNPKDVYVGWALKLSESASSLGSLVHVYKSDNQEYPTPRDRGPETSVLAARVSREGSSYEETIAHQALPNAGSREGRAKRSR